ESTRARRRSCQSRSNAVASRLPRYHRTPIMRRSVDTVTGSSVVMGGGPPVVGPRFRRSVTLLAALVVVLFVTLVGGLLASRSRLDHLSHAESSLALVAGRTMDVRFVVEHQAPWERRVSELLLDDRTN